MAKCTDCWAGYGIGSPNDNTFTSVQTNMTVPKITCNDALVNQYGEQESTWGVFIDGYNTEDFAGATFVGYCFNTNGNNTATAEYYSQWFAVNATSLVSVGNIFPSYGAGDKLFLGISEASGTFTFTIDDYTLGCPTYCITNTSSGWTGMSYNSAECISDMGFSTYARGGAFMAVPSVAWKSVPFTNCKVDGLHLRLTPIGGVKSKTDTLTTYTAVSQYKKKGKTITLAEPTALTGKDNFNVDWKNDGP